jgi:competence protein CoiA-like protein
MTGRIAPGTPKTGVLLAWASDREARKVHVAALDAGERRRRGPFACLGCGEEVVAKLGAERARHFAHRPGSTCPLTRPETLLHLDAKERLLALCAEAFAGRLAVKLRARCPACRRETPIDLAEAGDAAAGEGAAGALRADVLVTRRGAPALALEVKVTHAVDAAKEEALTQLGLPALEIDAREAWEEPFPGGVAVRVARTLGAERCPACHVQARAEGDRSLGGEAAAVAELEVYRARGLMGPRPGPALAGQIALTAIQRRELARSFRCPDCQTRAMEVGARLARHACPGAPPRPVAWRGYDGQVVELGWWRRG